MTKYEVFTTDSRGRWRYVARYTSRRLAVARARCVPTPVLVERVTAAGRAVVVKVCALGRPCPSSRASARLRPV